MEQQRDQAIEATTKATSEYHAVHNALIVANKKNDKLHPIILALSSRLANFPSSHRQRMAESPKFIGDKR